jgi:hypothetical protein
MKMPAGIARRALDCKLSVFGVAYSARSTELEIPRVTP